MHKVLITGITGFLGAKIAEYLISDGISVIGLKRPGSDIWRCNDFKEKVNWIDIEGGYQEMIISSKPDTIIHCAWIGVSAGDRDNWSVQAENLNFLISLIELAKELPLSKFICLGSQAEYGYINGIVSEDQGSKAANAYGAIKLACLEILKGFAEVKQINWIWLRIFSVFGEKEDDSWLIPSVIKNLQGKEEMNLTKGEQRYAYLYIDDFAEIVRRIIKLKIHSGIYNVSSNDSKPLYQILQEITNLIKPSFRLNFGTIPYRDHQSMHIEGDMSKLKLQIGEMQFTNFNVALKKIINYRLNNKN
jgi:nucleoside-diphosphate-sugar epimerase